MPLTNDEKEMVQGEIVNFLNNSKRELLPNEERVIKKIAKKYNIFNSILTIIAVLAGLGLIKYSTDLATEKVKMEVVESASEDLVELRTKTMDELKAFKQVAQEDLKRFKEKAEEEVETTLKEARNETNEYKKEARHLLVELCQTSAEAKMLGKKITADIRGIKAEVESKISEAKGKIADLDETLEAISKKEKILKDKEWVFNALRDSSVNLLKVNEKEDEKQYAFNIGELLLIWGKGKTQSRDGWTRIRFNKKFANKDEIATCVIAKDRDKTSKKTKAAYPIVRKVTEDMIEFRFVRKKSGLTDYHDVNNVNYNYIAIGKKMK